MGRITIFTLLTCPHCKRAKGTLAKHNLTYTEISLTSHPDKRNDMLSLSDRLTVPQIFFNNLHVGGADDLNSYLDREWGGTEESIQIKYEELLAEDDPSDPRLQVPTTKPVVQKPPPPRSEEDSIILPGDGSDDKKESVLVITAKLLARMPAKKRSYRLKDYFQVFTGQEGTSVLMDMYGTKTREEAVEFGKYLQKRQILDHVVSEHEFEDSDKLFYHLQPYKTPKVLNTFRVWTDRVDPDPMALLARLTSLMSKITNDCTNEETGLVDYIAAKQHVNYAIFEEASCEIQAVNMEKMDGATKLAFGINLYNLMIKHAFIKVGIANTVFARTFHFFDDVRYNIGGHSISFMKLENGILRGNRIAPGHLAIPFPVNDPRRKLIVSKPDCRIHFALNCGAKSCPPIKKFTPQAINEELRIVALAFCEQDDNVFIDKKNNQLHLTKIMQWYLTDFAPTLEELPRKVVTFLRGQRRDELQYMIDSRNPIVVKFKEYDWSTDSARNIEFKPRSLSPVKSKFNPF